MMMTYDPTPRQRLAIYLSLAVCAPQCGNSRHSTLSLEGRDDFFHPPLLFGAPLLAAKHSLNISRCCFTAGVVLEQQ